MNTVLSVKSENRWVFKEEADREPHFQITQSRLDRLIHKLPEALRPNLYKEENRKAVRCFKDALIERIGLKRFERISERHKIDLDQMEKYGHPLLSRVVARLAIGINDVRIEDIEELIELCKQEKEPSKLPSLIPKELHALLRKNSIKSFRDLNPREFLMVYRVLSKGLDYTIPSHKKIAPRNRYDEALVNLERIYLTTHKPFESEDTFYHYMVTRVMKRELHVGVLLPGYKKKGFPLQYYYVAGKIVTGRGMVSYVLLPLSPDSYLKPLRFFRGTATETSELDVEQTVGSDVEPNIGQIPYQSSRRFDEELDYFFPNTKMIYIGHSLGASIVQHYVTQGNVREAYLFNGPGIDLQEVEAFNQKIEKTGETVRLYIRDTEGDNLSAFGQIHLGYRAPKNVLIDYKKYVPVGKHSINNLHVFVFPHEASSGKKPVSYRVLQNKDVDLDAELDHRKKKPVLEYLRRKVGTIAKSAYLFSKRGLKRSILRTQEQQGLQVGHFEKGMQLGFFEKGKWKERHLKIPLAHPLKTH